MIEKIDVQAGGSEVNTLSACFLIEIDFERFRGCNFSALSLLLSVSLFSLSKMESQILFLDLA